MPEFGQRGSRQSSGECELSGEQVDELYSLAGEIDFPVDQTSGYKQALSICSEELETQLENRGIAFPLDISQASIDFIRIFENIEDKEPYFKLTVEVELPEDEGFMVPDRSVDFFDNKLHLFLSEKGLQVNRLPGNYQCSETLEQLRNQIEDNGEQAYKLVEAMIEATVPPAKLSELYWPGIKGLRRLAIPVLEFISRVDIQGEVDITSELDGEIERQAAIFEVEGWRRIRDLSE